MKALNSARSRSESESDSESELVEVESDTEVGRVELEASHEVSSGAVEAKPVEASRTAEKKIDEVIAEVSRPVYFEVVVVGVMRFMPVDEIPSDAKAKSARRINRRVDGALQPTTAVVLRFDDDPPEHVAIHQVD